MKFAKRTYGNGLTGMNLNLNLTQCEVLKSFGEEIKQGVLDGNQEIIVQAAANLLPFFELFKEFSYKNDPNLWLNEENPKKSYPEE